MNTPIDKNTYPAAFFLVAIKLSFAQYHRYYYITFLREPVARYISEFRHVQRGATWRASRLVPLSISLALELKVQHDLKLKILHLDTFATAASQPERSFPPATRPVRMIGLMWNWMSSCPAPATLLTTGRRGCWLTCDWSTVTTQPA